MKTNTQLKDDVMAELRCEPAVTSVDINVSSHDGVVTLSGTVPHYAEKCAAERAARSSLRRLSTGLSRSPNIRGTAM